MKATPTGYSVTDNSKFCIDCKHCDKSLVGVGDGAGSHLYRCVAPLNVAGRDLVTGAVTFRTPRCSDQREQPSLCGPEGKWFWPRNEK